MPHSWKGRAEQAGEVRVDWEKEGYLEEVYRTERCEEAVLASQVLNLHLVLGGHETNVGKKKAVGTLTMAVFILILLLFF